MALKISQLAAGVLPVVDRDIPLLKDHPEGNTVKIQLLSRRERIEIYPDAAPGDEADKLSQAMREINDRATPVRQARADASSKLSEIGKSLDAAKGQPLDSDDVSAIEDSTAEVDKLVKKMKELDEQIAELETEYKEATDNLTTYEMQRATKLIQATLTDDTGAFLSDEQATALVEEKQNEKVTKQIIEAIMSAHGVEAGDQGEP